MTEPPSRGFVMSAKAAGNPAVRHWPLNQM
jgi:hypothetical protein